MFIHVFVIFVTFSGAVADLHPIPDAEAGRNTVIICDVRARTLSIVSEM